MKSRHTRTFIPDQEFEAVLSDSGLLRLPGAVPPELIGSQVSVRIRPRELARALSQRGVADEEVSRIAAIQSEEPGAVIRFLLSEGALRRRRRA